MHGFNVLVIKLVLLCGRHVSSGRSTGLIQNISNIKVKCLVEFLANLAKYCRNLDIITVTSTKIVDIAIRNAGIDQRIFDELQESVTFLVIGKEQTLSKESRNDEVLVPKWLCPMTEALCHTHGGSDDDLVD